MINRVPQQYYFDGILSVTSIKKLMLILLIISSSLLTTEGWSQNPSKKTSKASQIPPLTTTSETALYKHNINNLFLIQSRESHLVTVFDGEIMKKIHQFSLQSQLKGEPVYDSTRRYAYLLTTNGWLNKFDNILLKVIAKIRIGIETSNIAISNDNKYLIAGNTNPRSLVILNTTDFSLAKTMAVIDKKGKSTQISAVHNATSFDSFIVSLKDSNEIWQINYQNPSPAGFGGWVHDYRKDSGEATVRLFPIRHIKLPSPIDDFFFDENGIKLISISSTGKGQVIDLDLGRKVANHSIAGIPYLSRGEFWKKDKTILLAMASTFGHSISIIDTSKWQTIKKIPINGSGLLTQNQYPSSTIWISMLTGSSQGSIKIFDKNDLKIIKTLHPPDRDNTIPVGFTRSGRYAFVSTLNALIFYDTDTFEEVKRISNISKIKN